MRRRGCTRASLVLPGLLLPVPGVREGAAYEGLPAGAGGNGSGTLFLIGGTVFR